MALLFVLIYSIENLTLRAKFNNLYFYPLEVVSVAIHNNPQ